MCVDSHNDQPDTARTPRKQGERSRDLPDCTSSASGTMNDAGSLYTTILFAVIIKKVKRSLLGHTKGSI